MRVIIPLLVVLPLFAAGVSMALWRRLLLQQVLGVLVVATGLVLAVVVLVEVAEGGPVAVAIGGWPAPIGIT
ncbi:MAG TPA: hypothetical protein VIK95_00495, partial [Egibacteraceae bacterium]